MSSPTMLAPENKALTQYPATLNPSQTLASLQACVERANEIIGLITGQRGSNQYSLVEGLSTLQRQFGNKAAQITQVLETAVDAEKALAQRTTILEATTLALQGTDATISARITSVETASTTATNALAQRATTLEAEVVNARQGQASISARITQVDQARASGDSALSGSISTWSAEIVDARQGYASVAANISAANTARVNGDNALSSSINTWSAEVVGGRQGYSSLAANISAVNQARIDGDGALSSSINTLSNTVGANSATLSTVQQVANANSLRFGVTGYINGSTGGFVFTGLLRNDGAVVYNMEFNSNVVINGNLLVTGSVDTPRMTYSAVNQLSYAIKGERTTYLEAGQAWQDVLAITVAGGGDNAYAFVTAALYVAMYIPTNATGQSVLRVWSDTYGDISGTINPVVGAVDNAQGTGAYGATNISFLRPTTVNNDTFRLQIKVTGGRYFFLQNPTALYAEMRKR